MRVIEFRGKRLDKGGWVYGNLVSDGKRYFIIYDNDITECTRYGERYIEASRYFEVDPETVGQCTGLKDKNGTKIYEGDIIKIFGIGYNYGYSQQIVSVSWDAEKMCFMCGKSKSLYNYSTISWAKIEVIGNIHDNPELLEVE
jgi:uncharacterized phage protein (TIGR01671 family)